MSLIDKIKENPITAVSVVLFIVVLIIIISMRSTPTPKTKEGFSFANIANISNISNDETFALSNLTEEDVENFENFENSQIESDIVENFPQPAPMNVMYSDANGNLATTTDLGVEYLTVTGNSAVSGNSDVKGNLSVKGDIAVTGPIQANNRINFIGKSGAKGISLDSSDTHLRFMNTDGKQQFVVHTGEYPQYSRTGISIGKWVDNTNYSISADKNINTDAQVNTMGRSNYPNGWGGGVRTFDLYGSGTLGWGDEKANLSTTIGGGNIWTAGKGQFGNLGTYNGEDNASAANQNGGLTSWWGIGFRNTLGNGSAALGHRSKSVEDNNGTSHVFDTRWGNTSMRGTLTADGDVKAGGTLRCSQICIGNTCIGEKELKYLTDGFFLKVDDSARNDNGTRWKANEPIHLWSDGVMRAHPEIASAFKLAPNTLRLPDRV